MERVTLPETEELYRIIAETASDALITIDESSTILFINHAAEKIFGYPLAEMMGQQLTMLMPEYLRHLHQAGINRYVETGHKHISWEGVELPGLHKSGREVPLELSFGEFEKDGKRFFTGIVRDITDRKRAEANLQSSEQRYRYLADAMPQIVWTARPDGYLDYYNRRWFEYTGMSLEQTQGWGWQPVLHPEDVEECLKRWATAVETGEAYEIEYRFRRASDSTYRWHLGRGVPMRDESGEIVKWFGTATDIDDRKRAEDSLRFIAEASEMLASSLDYETTLANVARLAVPRLADWCVVHIVEEDSNPQQLAAAHTDESKLGLLRELNRKYPSGLDTAHGYRRVAQTGQPELIPEITDSLLAEVSRDAEHLKLLRELGLKSTLCVPLTARGRTLGAITFATAESGRIYDSSSLTLAEDLARRAASAVDNARLYQAGQMANRTKDEFLATLSHELRTPLTPIIGWVHMIRSGMLKREDLERGLAAVESSSQALTRLINDLLDMSAILSGKMRIEKLPVLLNATIKDAVETVRTLAEKRNINLESRLCEDNRVIINGDRTRLVQIFWNVIANAVKFSQDGSRVRITCEATERESRVIVEDEGLGITSEFLPHIFERFRLGIGLALVKSFVEAHGGSVTAESAGEGRGSRLTVRLPRLVMPVESDRPSGVKRAEARSIPNNINVLVVEDSPDTLEMLRQTLKIRGYSVTPCESAAEALLATQSASFDIIISDIGMPEVDGYELIRRLRGLPHLSNVPAIALTGYAAGQDIDSALAAGFDVHIPKPVDPADLAAQMEKLLQGKRADDGR